MGRGSNSAAIVGRDRELAQISTALSPEVADLLVLALLGDAGIGKTVLLDAAIDRSRDNGVHILRGRGSTAETPLAFAGLHQVLFPVLDRAEALSLRHRSALLDAFGIGIGEHNGPPDRMDLSMATLTMLSGLTALPALSGLATLLIFLLHVVCHKDSS